VVFGRGVINEVIGEEFLENVEGFSPPYTSSVLRRTTAFRGLGWRIKLFIDLLNLQVNC
jgi:hypothetical protein